MAGSRRAGFIWVGLCVCFIFIYLISASLPSSPRLVTAAGMLATRQIVSPLVAEFLIQFESMISQINSSVSVFQYCLVVKMRKVA